MARETGVVKWFSREKGYGFVRRESGEEVFVHHTDIEGEGFRALEQGETVEFEIVSSDRGPRAGRVRRAGGDPADAGDRQARSDRRGNRSRGNRSRSSRRSGGDSGRARKRSGVAATERAEPSRGGEQGSPKGGLATLAQQLRARLGRRFAGFGD